MIISFSGNDGSGKTTHAKKLIDSLSTSEKIDKESIKFIPEESFFILDFFRNRHSRKNLDNASTFENASKLKLSLFALVIFVDQYLESFFYRVFKKNQMIIKDRSIIDWLATFRYLGLNNSIINILFNKIQYDLNFYLDLDIKILKERVSNRTLDKRRDYPVNFFEEKERIYKDIVKRALIVNIKDPNQDNIKSIVDLYSKLKDQGTVTLVGMDGTGKSTQIKNISERLRSLGINYASYHYYYNYLILKIFRVLRKEKKQETTNQVNQEKKTKSKLWMIFVLIDGYLQYFIAKIIHRKKIIIFDRSFVDYLISFKYMGLIQNVTKYLDLIPLHGKFVFLTVSPETAFKRKPEHSLEFFNETNSMYLKLIDNFPKKILHLDTTKKEPEKCTEEILNFLSK